MGSASTIDAIRYEPGDPFPPEHRDASVVVVDYDNAEETGARFAELPRLRLLQTLNAGFEQWLPQLPTGVLLSNGRGAHGGSSAEWVVAALLSIYRELPHFARAQADGVWDHRETETLIGKRIIVLGAGDLAVNLATRLTPFDTEVTLFARTARPGVSALADIDAVLPQADAVVALLPLTDATRHIVDAAFLARLPDNAILVNAGRGGLVDTDALVAELNSDRLRAALDVTDPEPLPPGHPLWSAPGLLLTPHVAGDTVGAWRRAYQVALQQIEVFAAGGTPPNLVAG